MNFNFEIAIFIRLLIRVLIHTSMFDQSLFNMSTDTEQQLYQFIQKNAAKEAIGILDQHKDLNLTGDNYHHEMGNDCTIWSMLQWACFHKNEKVNFENVVAKGTVFVTSIYVLFPFSEILKPNTCCHPTRTLGCAVTPVLLQLFKHRTSIEYSFHTNAYCGAKESTEYLLVIDTFANLSNQLLGQ